MLPSLTLRRTSSSRSVSSRNGRRVSVATHCCGRPTTPPRSQTDVDHAASATRTCLPTRPSRARSAGALCAITTSYLHTSVSYLPSSRAHPTPLRKYQTPPFLTVVRQKYHLVFEIQTPVTMGCHVIGAIYTGWSPKGEMTYYLRRVWGLPYDCRTSKLQILSDTMAMYDVTCKRSLMFIKRCLSGESDLVRFIVRYGVL